MKNDEMTCSFCGRPAGQVKHIVAGPNGSNICEDCLQICAEIVRREKKKRGGRIERASYNTKTMGTEGSTEDVSEDKGYTEVDIRPHIYEMYADDDNAVHIMASAGSKDNIRPDAVIRAIYEREGFELTPYALAVVRNELYTYGDNGEGLIPLSEAGRVF